MSSLEFVHLCLEDQTTFGHMMGKRHIPVRRVDYMRTSSVSAVLEK